MLRIAAFLLLMLASTTSVTGASTAEEFDRESAIRHLIANPHLILQAVDRVREAQQPGTGNPPTPADDPVIAYLMENPGVILEAIDRFEAAQKVAAHADALFAQAGDPVVGNPDGAVTLVEFTDYNCPYCQAMVPVMQRLVAEQPELRIIYKEMPILAETSWYAAQVALAASEQGRYEDFHTAMFGVGARSEALIDNMAQLSGVDLEGIDLSAFDGAINANLGLGQDLGLDGTPSFVIGDRIFVGQVGYEELTAEIEAQLSQN